jgi:pyruvate formate lyase activating enzyme
MKEALFYKMLNRETRQLQCLLCHQQCKISNESRGKCLVRENKNGILNTLVFENLVSESIDPIEKKPIFHLIPGSRSYSIATVGCNFRCQHCQNHQISQYPKHNKGKIPGKKISPEQLVKTCRSNNCQSISYTYVEPTIYYELALETSIIAKEYGIKNIFVSNGYTMPEPVINIAPYLDANNIDLKGFSEKFYHDVCGARLSPVLNTIIKMKELGVWVEITTLIIPGWNDSEKELKSIAKFIMSVDPCMPWHVTRFFPTYKMTDRQSTPLPVLKKAREIGLETGLKYVYEGNIPGQGRESTYCHSCKKMVIERVGYQIISNKLKDGSKCPFCKTIIPGIFT